MNITDVISCSIPNWYPHFSKLTTKSIIIPLPDGFTDYLLADGIVLPESEDLPERDSFSSDASEASDASDVDTHIEPPKFYDFDEKIKDGIKDLGGKVFPKLNWSSPRDASWIGLNNSCCCSSVSEIYLLLKSSYFIAHDLTEPFSCCEDNPKDSQPISVQYYLTLRQWIEIDPCTEYRCFVKNKTLIGITQREHSLYFGHISQQKDRILKDIISFFKRSLQNKFLCMNYVFDVFIEKKGSVILIDFNPFGQVTDSLLFEWSELKDIQESQVSLPEFRYVADNYGIQPNNLREYSIPTDIFDISTGLDSLKLVDLLKMKIREQSNEDSSDEE